MPCGETYVENAAAMILLKKDDAVLCRDTAQYAFPRLGALYTIGGTYGEPCAEHIAFGQTGYFVWLKEDPLMRAYDPEWFSLLAPEDDNDLPEPPAEAKEAAVMNLLYAADAGLISEDDAIMLPAHYARFKIEPVRFCIENNLNAFQFNIIKYTCRHDAKNGIQDLKKARRYMDMFIKFLEGDEDWWRAEGNGAKQAA